MFLKPYYQRLLDISRGKVTENIECRSCGEYNTTAHMKTGVSNMKIVDACCPYHECLTSC